MWIQNVSPQRRAGSLQIVRRARVLIRPGDLIVSPAQGLSHCGNPCQLERRAWFESPIDPRWMEFNPRFVQTSTLLSPKRWVPNYGFLPENQQFYLFFAGKRCPRVIRWNASNASAYIPWN